jgi:hypothetical protein
LRFTDTEAFGEAALGAREKVAGAGACLDRADLGQAGCTAQLQTAQHGSVSGKNTMGAFDPDLAFMA